MLIIREQGDINHDLGRDLVNFSGPYSYSITVNKAYEVLEENFTHYWIVNDKGNKLPYNKKFFDLR